MWRIRPPRTRGVRGQNRGTRLSAHVHSVWLCAVGNLVSRVVRCVECLVILSDLISPLSVASLFRCNNTPPAPKPVADSVTRLVST